MKESQLYLLAAFICLIGFITSMCYVLNNKKSLSSSFENTIVIILSLLILSKSIEYYEKYTFKLSGNH
tara:strand:- start:1073 stop:1276 length:204 start_codon:yes stop_codon:yes gene_type:complete